MLPVVIAKNNYWVLADNLSFAREEEPPGSGRKSEPVEEVAANVHRHDPVRLLAFYCQAVETQRVGKDIAEGAATLSANLFVLIPGEHLLKRAVVHLRNNGCDLFGIRYWERLE